MKILNRAFEAGTTGVFLLLSLPFLTVICMLQAVLVCCFLLVMTVPIAVSSAIMTAVPERYIGKQCKRFGKWFINTVDSLEIKPF